MLEVQAESTAGASPMYSKVIERTYQSGSGWTVKGRPNGLRVSGGSPPYDYSTIYWYDGRGRLNRLSGPGTPWNYVNYLYLADSDLVEKIEYRGPPQEGGYAFVASVIRTFEPNRDLVTSVENKWDSTTVSKFEYTNDALGRRTSVSVSGTAFTAAGTTGFDLFAYNDRNELTSARRYAGGTISNPSDPVYARHFEYAYDPIGNRETYEVSQGTATTYTTNELNQYTATANPSESFTYDDDGNLTQDGTYTYVWDAENRLIEAYPTNPTTGSQKCVMVYDYMNRRVKRTLYDWTGSAWSGTPAESRVFLYDGWNVLLSYNPAASMAIDREFTWGLDLSGQNGNPSVAGIHGAGGIGGLVAARRVGSPTKAYFCFYDANGNLSDCVKNSDGTLWSHVEYDPYGGPIVASDAGGLGHPFRYSTKYLDGVFEKHYYGYRYSDYSRGRWMNRDPIEEHGNSNLYRFCGNDPANEIDLLGLWSPSDHAALLRLSFWKAAAGLPVSRVCKEQILGILIDENRTQDIRWLFHLRRHYNRPVAKGENAATKSVWDKKYADYLEEEEAEFWKNLSAEPARCREALSSLGRLTHSWQDFFAHAIRRDGKGGKENSEFPGWEAWSAKPPVSGTPDRRGNFWPSSYGFRGGGEHPRREEPLKKNSPEYKARYEATDQYVVPNLGSFLHTWRKFCQCWCDDAEAH